MHVRIIAFVEPGECVQNWPRLLRSGRIIEVDQRMTVNRLLQNGEIGSDLRPINNLAGHLVHGSNLIFVGNARHSKSRVRFPISTGL